MCVYFCKRTLHERSRHHPLVIFPSIWRLLTSYNARCQFQYWYFLPGILLKRASDLIRKFDLHGNYANKFEFFSSVMIHRWISFDPGDARRPSVKGNDIGRLAGTLKGFDWRPSEADIRNENCRWLYITGRRFSSTVSPNDLALKSFLVLRSLHPIGDTFSD